MHVEVQNQCTLYSEGLYSILHIRTLLCNDSMNYGNGVYCHEWLIVFLSVENFQSQKEGEGRFSVEEKCNQSPFSASICKRETTPVLIRCTVPLHLVPMAPKGGWHKECCRYPLGGLFYNCGPLSVIPA